MKRIFFIVIIALLGSYYITSCILKNEQSAARDSKRISDIRTLEDSIITAVSRRAVSR